MSYKRDIKNVLTKQEEKQSLELKRLSAKSNI